MHKHNASFNKTVTKLVAILTKCFFPYLNPTSDLNSSDVGISHVAEITIGMDRYFIMPDCALYIIYILIYVCIVEVTIGEGVVVTCFVFIIKFVLYRIFTKNNIFYKNTHS